MYLRESVELVLKLAPAVEANEAVSFLRSNDDVKKKKTIFSLQKQFQDSEFAREFVKKNGIEVISELLNTSTGNSVAYSLAALQSLMARDAGCNNLSQKFIMKIVEFMMNPALNICRPATAILIELVRAGPNSNRLTKNYGFQVPHLVAHTPLKEREKKKGGGLLDEKPGRTRLSLEGAPNLLSCPRSLFSLLPALSHLS
jgi:engulfment/cell motility protein 1